MLRIKTVKDLKSLPKPYRLQGANLEDCYLSQVDLSGANFDGANLDGSGLHWATLDGCSFKGANLQNADLRCASMKGADFTGANIRGVYFEDNDTAGAIPAKPLVELPPVGEAFTAWKKVHWPGNTLVLKLTVPADSPRVSTGISRKCRVQKVFVEAVFHTDGVPYHGEKVFHSFHNCAFIYVLGSTAEEPGFDPNPFLECTRGIHVFLTQNEVEAY
jgi:hypothetical protein